MPDANTYASLAMFTTYASAHLYSTAFDGATADRRNAALLMATRQINTTLEFNGAPLTTSQAMDWPRRSTSGVPYGAFPITYGAPFYGPAVDVQPSPKRLQDATCELALALLAFNYVADDENRGIRSVSLGQGAVAVTFDAADRKRPLPHAVELLLLPFGVLRYCRANVLIRRVQ